MAQLLEAWCFKGVEKFIFLFFCFWLGLLFCRLLSSDVGELVSMMKRNFGCSMDILYELCESQVWWRIGGSFQGSKGKWRGKKIYKAGQGEGMQTFWRGDEDKFLDFMITIKCKVDFGIGL